MIKCGKESLKLAVSLAQKALAKQVLQKATAITIEIGKDKLSVSSFNLNFGYTTEINIEQIEPIFVEGTTWFVDVSLFSKILNRCRGTEVLLDIDENTDKLIIESGTLRAEIDLLFEPPGLYVMDTEKSEEKPVPTRAAMLAHSVYWAADKDILRPNYSCCSLHITPDSIFVAATDTVMMAIAEEEHNYGDINLNVLIPVTAIDELVGLNLDEASVSVGPNTMTIIREVSGGKVTFISKLLNTNYPDLKAWATKNIKDTNAIECSAMVLIDTLTRLAIMPKRDFNASVGSGELLYPCDITYSPDDSKLYFYVDMPGLEITDEMDVETSDGSPFKVRVDMKKVIKAAEGALALADTDMLSLAYLGEKKPIKIEIPGYMALVMPLLVK